MGERIQGPTKGVAWTPTQLRSSLHFPYASQGPRASYGPPDAAQVLASKVQTLHLGGLIRALNQNPVSTLALEDATSVHLHS